MKFSRLIGADWSISKKAMGDQASLHQLDRLIGSEKITQSS